MIQLQILFNFSAVTSRPTSLLASTRTYIFSNDGYELVELLLRWFYPTLKIS
jgi:hypothetical protein